MSEKPDKTPSSGRKPRQTKIKPPRGTRDLYPVEAARRRWLMERWREVSIRHGFEEVDGPTYENADLYAVKSGEGILSELFQAFSGKSPEEVERVKETGRAGYALRPEFTPTLARMYAAKANTLPKPCKWFMAGPFFRAERPQRGRLREFLQWNVDVIGGEIGGNLNDYDAEVIAVLVSALEALGLGSDEIRIKVGSRNAVRLAAQRSGVSSALCDQDLSPVLLQLLDDRAKITPVEYERRAAELGLPKEFIEYCHPTDRALVPMDATQSDLANIFDVSMSEASQLYSDFHEPGSLSDSIRSAGIEHWCEFDSTIVRGLAYYTSNVFEAIADGERAVAGGGRYDNLIELFGGPPTPAVGFAMGDVVLGLLLQDKGLMPSDDELLGLVGQHPDAFVLSIGSEKAEAQVRPVVAMLRRGRGGRDAHPTDAMTHGSESRATKALPGLHVRHSYKATKKVDKLLNEAKKQGARLAVIIQDGESCIVKDLHTGTQWDQPVALDDLHARLIAAL